MFVIDTIAWASNVTKITIVVQLGFYNRELDFRKTFCASCSFRADLEKMNLRLYSRVCNTRPLRDERPENVDRPVTNLCLI